ncbi:MAG: PEP-CTERM sorting domain-containing protein [Phenylobacterium sp.]|nr:MAG: PEP-CTERM sorting domain-containing protein [Phenylobacterium sp.]
MTPNSYATGVYANGVTLQQGAKYWVLAVAPTNAPLQRWNTVNYVDAGPHFNFIGTSDCCAQEVTSGIYVASNAINGFALKVTIASAATAVPEPATWTLLIAGFGMIGAAARRKTRAFASA